MTAFSLQAESRWDAVDLQRHLGSYSPWLLELSRGRWYVRGSVEPDAVADLKDVLERWAAARRLAIPPLVLIDTSPGAFGELA